VKKWVSSFYFSKHRVTEQRRPGSLELKFLKKKRFSLYILHPGVHVNTKQMIGGLSQRLSVGRSGSVPNVSATLTVTIKLKSGGMITVTVSTM